ncbi:MAG: TIGR02147 family protein [Fibrobacteria bacterium]|nr:TIGR02147 family protein [Fibrobacteria bacterium]
MKQQNTHQPTFPDIFDYLDYRKFISDWIDAKSSTGTRYSKRAMANELGCDSAFLIRVIQGKKSLTDKFIPGLAAILQLNKSELHYLKLLLQFDKTRASVKKKELLDRLTRLRKKKTRILDYRHYEFYDKWYYTVVREILDYFKFKDDFATLARQLEPPIRAYEAKKAIRVLEKLQLIKKDKSGYYTKSDPVISTGEGWTSVAIANYQLGNMELAKAAFEKYSSEARDFSTLTLSLSSTTMVEIIKRLRQFRSDCLDLASKDDQANCVYQMNFQTFPVSKINKGRQK